MPRLSPTFCSTFNDIKNVLDANPQHFCWTGLHASAMSTVTISRYLHSDDKRIQLQSTQRFLDEILWGNLTNCPYPNHMIIP